MKKPQKLHAAYRQLQQQLSRIGYLSHGSVLKRPVGQQGSRYIWTRKVKRKTITVALSEQQYKRLRSAVANQRRLDKIISRMQVFSRQQIFQNIPGVHRRKPLDKKVLGLI